MLIAPFRKATSIAKGCAEILRPPRRISPTQAASETLRTEKGAWLPEFVPYLHEPLDMLAGRAYRGIVFVGPARTGKTMGLILGGIAYVVTADPGDMLVVQMSQDAARDFSRMDLDRAIRHSPEMARRMSPRARDDNVFDKAFRSGIVLKLGWPAVSQLSSKTLQYVFLTDYDRPENAHNVDGEGPMWDLALKRTETFMSRGKCLAESSPGEEITEPKWRPSTPHEAPPARGILELYNRGTRARWFWPCLHCGEHFQARPGLANFDVPEFDELCEIVSNRDIGELAGELAQMPCPHCGAVHRPSDRAAMNAGGLWIHEGEDLVDGEIIGVRRNVPIASFWLGGVAASYQPWPSILQRYLQAVQTYVRTGDEEPLRSTTNTDQGAPYLPQSIKRKRTAEDLALRIEDWPRGLVPPRVRFLTAAVDVQANRFVVTVYGWGIGLESWIIERFSIKISDRRDPRTDRAEPIDPAGYAEDWRLLVDQVLEKTYSTGDGVELTPMLTLCDSGGRAGVTDKAYKFWRWLRKKKKHRKMLLVKGTGNRNAPRVLETWPDARSRKDRTAGRGDVPVWQLNVNTLKDGVSGDLLRDKEGPGYVHIPAWIDDAWFEEITAETRTEKGWKNETSAPNEAFDLHVYNRAACIILRAEAINWERPPKWAREPEPADDVQDEEEPKPKRQAKAPRRNWVSEW